MSTSISTPTNREDDGTTDENHGHHGTTPETAPNPRRLPMNQTIFINTLTSADRSNIDLIRDRVRLRSSGQSKQKHFPEDHSVQGNRPLRGSENDDLGHNIVPDALKDEVAVCCYSILWNSLTSPCFQGGSPLDILLLYVLDVCQDSFTGCISYI